MIDILGITLPIYLIVGMGFLLTRGGLFAKAHMVIFGRFVINLALPALLLRSLTQGHFRDIFNISYLATYLCATLVTLVLGYQYARRFSGQSTTASALYAMGMCSSNSGFVGYPILLLTLAPVAGVALALNMIVENLIVIPMLLMMAEMGRGRGASSAWHTLRESLLRLLRTPLIIALMIGLVLSLADVRLPVPLAQTVNMFANASGVLSLFVIGGTLVGLPFGGLGKRVLPVVLGKLVLHPMMVVLMVLLLPMLGLTALHGDLRMAVILMAAMPVMGIYPILTQAHGLEDFSAAALLVATVASFFTLSALIAVLRAGVLG